jgi:outer membrane receptor for monomeric catechols
MVPLGLNFFHPSGWSLGLRGTYYDQRGDFSTINTPPTANYPYYMDPSYFYPGHDNFWVMDAFLSYRLPKRYGFISFGVKNLLDQHFLFADTDFNAEGMSANPVVRPDRTYIGMVTLYLP